VNDIVFGGFGGGCGDFNQTGLQPLHISLVLELQQEKRFKHFSGLTYRLGWIAGVNSQTGVLTTLWAIDSGAEAPPVGDGFYAGGGGGSVWQAGVGFSSDRPDRFFFTTANGLG
jgi:hypothetical protein